ncbi:hypothetical protein NB311A_13911 [Nitrobacter sp. Nb-311A]|nr:MULTISPECIES: hypothetical protein [unclassified Nitrobacter]EAQ34354.1 hypothetical protein NB311A_13911 [Nitrobacter sp. Nb-311A]MCV0387743.1 hypothetical protein [Nitrobacter sp.]
MNDFWEWRSSSREFEGRRDSTRGGKIGLIVGIVLFVILGAAFAIFEYAQ